MFKFSKFLIAGAGLAALAGAAPSAAQYYGYSSPYNYGYSQYNNSYRSYGYAPMVNTSLATQQCTAAVQNRLRNRYRGAIMHRRFESKAKAHRSERGR